jgi:DNA-binding transcriptional LysR family regulator
VEFRELAAFVAVVEEGGMSAASRRLHVSQSALSQTVSSLEREFGITLLVRSSTGVRPTEAGETLLGEARAVLARHAQAVRTMAAHVSEGSGVIRLGIPLELSPDLLPQTMSRFVVDCPDTRVVPQHMSTAAQLAALRDDELDVGLVRERPAGAEFDAMLVVREKLGILIASELAVELADADGIRLDALGGLRWVSFPRSASPAWFDQLTATLRSHGVDVGPPAEEGQELIPPVKLVGVGSGQAFALAPKDWPHPLPEGVRWSPLVDNPLIRRTWVVWPANSHRRDIGHLIAAFDVPYP